MPLPAYSISHARPAARRGLRFPDQQHERRSQAFSRKRLAPQLLFKGGILNAWNKKLAVAINTGFFNTLPPLESINPAKADIAWFVYDLVKDSGKNIFTLQRTKVAYTKFMEALDKITHAEPGDIADFMDILQDKVDEKLENNIPPDSAVIASPI